MNSRNSALLFKQHKVQINRIHQKSNPTMNQRRPNIQINIQRKVSKVKCLQNDSLDIFDQETRSRIRRAENASKQTKHSSRNNFSCSSTKMNVLRMVIHQKRAVTQSSAWLEKKYKDKLNELRILNQKFKVLKNAYERLSNLDKNLEIISPRRKPKSEDRCLQTPSRIDECPLSPLSPLCPDFVAKSMKQQGVDLFHFAFNLQKVDQQEEQDQSNMKQLFEKERNNRIQIQKQNEYLIQQIRQLKKRKDQLKYKFAFQEKVIRLENQNKNLQNIINSMGYLLKSNNRQSLSCIQLTQY